MELKLDDEKKLAMLWLTREESALYRQEGRDFLQPLLDSYMRQKLKTAVFLSGAQPLLPLTQDLLVHGQKNLAEQSLKGQQL